MASPHAREEIAFRITRTFPHPRERVFRAWTEPEALKQWFAPTDDYTTTVPVFELRPGGGYRVEMRHKGGNVHTVAGAFREVKAPERLVYTWKWVDQPDAVETLVTVQFRERGGSTEVALTHELFPSEAARDEHDKGWTGCLDRLARSL